jgi:hypothetical protein
MVLDTDRDFSAAERHVLQKLFLWETMAGSLEQFREKTREALQKGWNASGPIPMTPRLAAVASDMEIRLVARLKASGGKAP